MEYVVDVNPESCGITTPTFDEVSKSNVTWTNVMDALDGILSNCNVDGNVFGQAKILHETGTSYLPNSLTPPYWKLSLMDCR